jgi:hypothetical protein
VNAETGTVLAVVTLAATVCGWVIRGARTAERFQQTQAQAKKDADGIARMVREEKSVEQRRWLHEIADKVEEADSQEKRARVANRIREDAWRI